MRPVFKWIFYITVLAALIFQSFALFYFINSYSAAQKKKNSPIFDTHDYQEEIAYHFASVTYPPVLVSEIDNTVPDPLTGAEGNEIHGGDMPPWDFLEGEEQEPDEAYKSNSESAGQTISGENEDGSIYYEDAQIDSEMSGSFYTEKDLLYSILLTMKINQQIMICVIAVAVIILIFNPIVKNYG